MVGLVAVVFAVMGRRNFPLPLLMGYSLIAKNAVIGGVEIDIVCYKLLVHLEGPNVTEK